MSVSFPIVKISISGGGQYKAGEGINISDDVISNTSPLSDLAVVGGFNFANSTLIQTPNYVSTQNLTGVINTGTQYATVAALSITPRFSGRVRVMGITNNLYHNQVTPNITGTVVSTLPQPPTGMAYNENVFQTAGYPAGIFTSYSNILLAITGHTRIGGINLGFIPQSIASPSPSGSLIYMYDSSSQGIYIVGAYVPVEMVSY